MFRFCSAGLIALCLALAAHAQVQTRTITYSHDGVELEGYLAVPEGASDDDDRPGILVIHEWWGLNDYVKRRARELAELGYVAFAADMYGKGKITDDPKQAGAWAGELYGDRDQMRRRALAGLRVLEEIDEVDDDELGAIGYCFGGTVVTELAYADVDDLEGVVSFHGNPQPIRPEDRVDDDDDDRTRILFLHGADDPMVSDESLQAVFGGLDERGIPYEFIEYPGAVHGFTNPEADDRGIDGLGYDQDADEQSWREMRRFFRRVFDDDADPGTNDDD